MAVKIDRSELCEGRVDAAGGDGRHSTDDLVDGESVGLLNKLLDLVNKEGNNRGNQVEVGLEASIAGASVSKLLREVYPHSSHLD